jgi:hypothetical protein
MYCPQCGAEYKPGVYVCADCGVKLTAAPPVEEMEPVAVGYADLEVILETADPTLLILAQSLLEGAGIRSHVRGGGALGLTAPGRLTGNPIAGPVRLEVREDQAAEARDVLQRLFAEGEEDEAEEHWDASAEEGWKVIGPAEDGSHDV